MFLFEFIERQWLQTDFSCLADNNNNKIRTTDYEPCLDYLDGLTITSCDYKEVFEQYKDVPGVVFLVDLRI